MRVRDWVWLSGFLCLGDAASAVAPFPEECRLERQASLPFTTDHGHVNIPVTADGHPFTFAVDTAAVFTSFDEGAVAQLGLEQHGIRGDIRLTDSGGAEALKYARIESLIMGRLKSDNMTLVVTQLGVEDGLIAPDLLRNFDLDFDFAGHTLNLFKPHPCADHVVYWTDDYAAVPFILTPQGHIRAEVLLNGKPLRAVFDTGSPISLIAPKKAGLESGETTLETSARQIGGANGGHFSIAPRTFDSLQIGKFLWPHPTLFLASDDQGWRSDGADMLIGLSEMQGLHLYIDYRHQKLYISRRLAPDTAQPPAKTPP